jgi:hypothetical protein
MIALHKKEDFKFNVQRFSGSADPASISVRLLPLTSEPLNPEL